jgi:hypothetical protein
MRKWALKMRMLTLRLMEGLVKPIVVGVEGIDMNSGEQLQKGLEKFHLCGPPWMIYSSWMIHNTQRLSMTTP